MNGTTTRSASLSAFATAFFAIGLFLVFTEAMFFQAASDLAHTPFSTRAIIGFHLFPSEIWFIVLGNAALMLFLARDRFEVSLDTVEMAKPLLLALAVYTVWFVYGILRGNGPALQEFREMVFTAIGFPAILYFARFADIRSIFGMAIPVGVIVVLAGSFATVAGTGFAIHNSVLMMATIAVAFYFMRLLSGHGLAVVGLGLVTLAFLLKFSKPVLALFLFVLAATFLLTGHLNRASVAWIFSRFKLRMLTITVVILIAIVATAVVIDLATDGMIQAAIRFYIFKERLTGGGGVVYGDMTGGRFAIWAAALESWMERPWFGHGLGASVEGLATGWFVKTQFHNYPVQLLHNTGLVGASIVIVSVLTWLRRVYLRILSTDDADARLLPASLFIFVLGLGFFGLYGHSLTYPPSTQLFWMCVGFLCVLPWERKR